MEVRKERNPEQAGRTAEVSTPHGAEKTKRWTEEEDLGSGLDQRQEGDLTGTEGCGCEQTQMHK